MDELYAHIGKIGIKFMSIKKMHFTVLELEPRRTLSK